MEQLNDLLNVSSPVLVAIFMTVFGKAFKAIDVIPDKWIPILMGLLGVPLFMAAQGWDIRNAMIGFVVGWGSVGANQSWRQFSGYNDPKAPITPTEITPCNPPGTM